MYVDAATAMATEEAITELKVVVGGFGDVDGRTEVHRCRAGADLKVAAVLDEHVARLELQVVFGDIPLQSAPNGERLDLHGRI